MEKLKLIKGTLSEEQFDMELQMYSKLAPLSRDILHAFFVVGKSYTEIATELGTYRQRVYQRVREHVTRLHRKV